MLLPLSLTAPETKSHYVYLKACTQHFVNHELSFRSMVKKILGVAKKQIIREKIKEGRV